MDDVFSSIDILLVLILYIIFLHANVCEREETGDFLGKIFELCFNAEFFW